MDPCVQTNLLVLDFSGSSTLNSVILTTFFNVFPRHTDTTLSSNWICSLAVMVYCTVVDVFRMLIFNLPTCTQSCCLQTALSPLLSNGRTITRPLSALYPLEADVASSIIMGTSSTPVSQDVSPEPAVKRPHRQAAKAARGRISEWSQFLL